MLRSPHQKTLCLPLILSVSLLFLSHVAHAIPSSKYFVGVRLKIGGKFVADTVPVRSNGTEAYAGIGVLKYLSATAKVATGGDSVLITTADSVQSEIGFARIEGQSLLPLSEVARVMHGVVVRGYGKSDLVETSDRETVFLLAKVTRIQVREGGLRVETSFPVPYRVRNVSEPGQYRGYVDCIGATVSDITTPQIGSDMIRNVRRVRTGQNESDVARVVVEFQEKQGLQIADSLSNSTRHIVARVTESTFGVSGNRENTARRDDKPLQQPSKLGGVVGGQDLDKEDFAASGYRSRPVISGYRPEPKRNSLDSRTGNTRRDAPLSIRSITANTTLALEQTGQALQELNYTGVKRLMAYLLEEAVSTTRIALEVPRNLRFRYRMLDNVLRIDLKIPEIRSGSLAGKRIVVDAGHGGAQTGANARDSIVIYEKNLTLAFALKLRTALEALGAEVIMTRDTDVLVPLYDRPALANSLGADLFVSIHNDSSPRANAASGTSTYYHRDDPKSRRLALAVQEAVVAVSGLPSRKALSDLNLYPNGLAVLRASKMPAILVEVAYINNDSDRKRLVDPEFQQTVADAIAQGVANYCASGDSDWGTENSRTRSPEPDKETPKESPKDVPDES
ncbi:MAG: N-acetylmuramoyl-L-alanine amidase [Armatimonadetes bacterium]|nr:N-acetylmuramoyl-L-alanine amidase [Armatimonadota bacterium]